MPCEAFAFGCVGFVLGGFCGAALRWIREGLLLGETAGGVGEARGLLIGGIGGADRRVVVTLGVVDVLLEFGGLGLEVGGVVDSARRLRRCLHGASGVFWLSWAV